MRTEGERVRAEHRSHANMIDEAIRESRIEARSRWQPALLVFDDHLEQHAAAPRAGRPFGAVEVEARARMTAASDLGSAGGWHPGGPNEPRHLIAFSQIRPRS